MAADPANQATENGESMKDDDRRDSPSFPTALGTSTADSISLLGHDLPSELMGQVDLGELALWLITRRRPTPQSARMFNTVMVALADHGFTPTAIAARMTIYSAPDSIQGALASGLLGGGSRFLGVTEDCGRFLGQALEGSPLPTSDEEFRALARRVVSDAVAQGQLIPGLGHPVHKLGDPRVPVIFRIAREENVLGPHLRLFESIGEVHAEILGKTLPLNGAGVCGAALADIGVPLELLRGPVLLARAAGLLGHIAEELETPIGPDIYRLVDRNAQYLAPESLK